MAEAHPVCFQWVIEAKARGAKVIHVDPRYTRTSALSDMHVPIRAGSDIAFLGGVINYILTEEKDFREYVVAYTNASAIVREEFVDTEHLDGLFSGFDDEHRVYDPTSWQFEGSEASGADSAAEQDGAKETGAGHQLGGHGPGLEMDAGGPRTDPTLQHPRCVYQVLKRHFARYTPELVEEVCGTPADQFLRVCEAWTANSGRDRTTALVYSVGWTQHSVGVQYIRAGAIIQALLGNMGRPGGGILALRGHASIQGSTDIPTLFNLLPGYLPMPSATPDDTLAGYLDGIVGTHQKGDWGNSPAYMTSLLKAWWGDAAQPDNDFCFDYLPRIDGDHSTYRQVLDMVDGKIPGYFLVGQNPSVGSSHGRLQRLGMAKLDWLVVRDLAMIESATFWKDSPEVETGEIKPKTCKTEVFFFPAASHVEKEGSFTNTQRMLQWRFEAVHPPGECRSDLHFFFHLGRMLREWLSGSDDPRHQPLLDLTWDYPTHGGIAEPSAEAVLQEINGRDATGRLLDTYAQMRPDGSTSGGCWIYTGVYAGGVNQAARRVPRTEQNFVAPEWGWAWPLNQRLLYNRASADPDGKPWSERKAYVWWDEQQQRWTGHDVPDFPETTPPHHQPPAGAVGAESLGGDDAFVMQADGKAWLYVPTGILDGPLPAHYEPAESPIRNPVYTQQNNPTRQVFPRPDSARHPSPPEPGSEVFPYLFTTYRLTEHHTAGGMSRTLPYLSELQPEFFCEVSPELALERGLTNLGWATIVTARSAIEARVMVTERMVPMHVGGKIVHQVGVPYHWGSTGLTTGDSPNDLIDMELDPNVHIQESKVVSCDVQPGSRPRGPAVREYVEDYCRRAGITAATGTAGRTTDLLTPGRSSENGTPR